MHSLFSEFWAWVQACLVRMEPAFSVAPVAIEIAAMGLLISWLQLRYMKRRDAAIDKMSIWAETHKLMVIFRFKREMLNRPSLEYPTSVNSAIAAIESFHVLKGQLDRMPDSTLVKEIAGFLQANWEAERWRSDDFIKEFDRYSRCVALLSQPQAAQKQDATCLRER